VSISVSIAMYCLIQLYLPVSKNLAPYRPLLKLFAIKAVGELKPVLTPFAEIFIYYPLVFLTFWQATFLAGLSMVGIVKGVSTITFILALTINYDDVFKTKYMTAADVNIGIGAILETVEMTYDSV
jgi:hypothetical protein